MRSADIQEKNDYGSESSNIERAKKMSIDELDKKQNRSQSIQNILSSSIARAKQKIQMMEQKKNIKDYRDSITTRSVQKKQMKESAFSASKYPPLSQPNNQEPQTSRSRKTEQIQTTRSRQPSSKTEGNSAVVNVVKNLQIKISELERLNESIEREKSIMTKELNNVSEEKRLLLQNMEEVKKKNLHLEQTIIKSNKQELKQFQLKVDRLEGQNMELKNQIKQWELKLKQQHQSHLSIQKSNEKRMKQKKEEQRNYQKTEMIYMSKLKETELYERNLHVKEKELGQKEKKMELKWKEIFSKEEEISLRQKAIEQKESKNYEQLVRHNQTMNLANQVRKQLEDKNNELKRLLDQDKKKMEQNKIKIKKLQQALNQQRSVKQQTEENITEMYSSKVNELEEQLQQIKQTHKYNSYSSKSKLSMITKNDKIDALRDQLADVIEQYEELLAKYKKNEDKLQNQQKQSKNYRSKFWKLKEIIAQISQKVNKMPQAIHSQLKLLFVKANKLESYEIQKSSLSHIYGTPSKKSRSNSMERNSSKLSNQKSKSKEKSTIKNHTINFTQLESSRKSNHSAKSKRSQKSERSLSKKKEVIISTTNKNMMNETDIKISVLQKEIQQLKNTYKKLVEIMNQKNDEETRNQLNNLVFQLQQKSEQLTKLKKQRKSKKI